MCFKKNERQQIPGKDTCRFCNVPVRKINDPIVKQHVPCREINCSRKSDTMVGKVFTIEDATYKMEGTGKHADMGARDNRKETRSCKLECYCEE